MPRPPRIVMWEYTCPDCGKTYVEQGPDEEEDFPRRCFSCVSDGVMAYYTRSKLT